MSEPTPGEGAVVANTLTEAAIEPVSKRPARTAAEKAVEVATKEKVKYDRLAKRRAGLVDEVKKIDAEIAQIKSAFEYADAEPGADR